MAHFGDVGTADGLNHRRAMVDVVMVAASCALTDEAQAVFCSDQGRKALSCVFLEKIVSTWVLCWSPHQNPVAARSQRTALGSR